SPGFAVPGSQSGHALQVRKRTEDSRVQAGQSLALQEIEARPVDGREVHGIGTAGEEEAESGDEGRRSAVAKRRGQKCPRHTQKAGTCLDSDRRRLLVWMWDLRASRPSSSERRG